MPAQPCIQINYLGIFQYALFNEQVYIKFKGIVITNSEWNGKWKKQKEWKESRHTSSHPASRGIEVA